jgi:hypothetical protein
VSFLKLSKCCNLSTLVPGVRHCSHIFISILFIILFFFSFILSVTSSSLQVTNYKSIFASLVILSSPLVFLFFTSIIILVKYYSLNQFEFLSLCFASYFTHYIAIRIILFLFLVIFLHTNIYFKV